MYLYFLPLADALAAASQDVVFPVPTPDGGLEHTAAQFLHASDWLRKAQSGEIILFPPQFLLLHLIAQFLVEPATAPTAQSQSSVREELKSQRKALQAFVRTGDPPWGEMCISPVMLMRRKEDGKQVLGLDKPGPELEGSGRRGESEHVVLVDFKKDGPRNLEVRPRKAVFDEERTRSSRL